MEIVLKDLKEDKYERKIIPNAYQGYQLSMQTPRGAFIKSDNIQFEDVPIVAPNGDLLVPKMNFRIQPGEHIMVIGPNGCGKSSLFRIIGNLWPHFEGTVHMPSYGDIMYVP